MTAYTLIHVELNNSASYDPQGIPTASDSVDGNAVAARGDLTVGSVTNFILTNGTVNTGLATNVTVGNPNGVGDPATMIVEGSVNTNATVWSNGNLTADSIQGSFSIQGGAVTLRLNYNAGGFFRWTAARSICSQI